MGRPGPPVWWGSGTTDEHLSRRFKAWINELELGSYLQYQATSGPNLINLLCRSNFPGPPTCPKKFCLIKESMNNEYRGPAVFQTPLKCGDRDCVYLAYCSHENCDFWYLGQTGSPACSRFQGHAADKTGPIFKHLRLKDHNGCCNHKFSLRRVGYGGKFARRLIFEHMAFKYGPLDKTKSLNDKDVLYRL